MSAIKVIGLCGSPHQNGNTAKLIRKVLEGAQSMNVETEFILLGKMAGKIYVQAPDHRNFKVFLKYAKDNGYNIEVASFAYPDVLDSDYQEIVNNYRAQLNDFKGTISIHGPFQDIIIHSKDRKIAEDFPLPI